jgi:WD40 repeat protein
MLCVRMCVCRAVTGAAVLWCVQSGLQSCGVYAQVLQDHSDEVWHVAFSPCGAMMASGSKDGTARVYDVRGRGAVALRHVLRGHTGPVAFLCWAPQGGLLATCGEH